MTSTIIHNIGTVVTGDLEKPTASIESIAIENGVITELNTGKRSADTVIDAQGITLTPGLIDAHVHPVAGEFTPRQNTIGWIESYLHGGITSMVSAGEIHHPGRPDDAEGTKALAVVNQKSYAKNRPSSVKLHAGTLILTDDLTTDDIDSVHENGVERTKIIFAMDDLDHARNLVAHAKDLGMVTMMHSGGSSVPGTKSIDEAMFKQVGPDIALHFNGGPTALPDAEWKALIEDTDMDFELVIAGNQRTSIAILETLAARDELHRLHIATDTPTGTGVVPCGMWLEASILASLTDIAAEEICCLMTGTPASHHGLDSGRIDVGRPADLCLIDSPQGSVADEALDSIENGDYPSVASVIVDGEVVVHQSRNTGPPKRTPRIS